MGPWVVPAAFFLALALLLTWFAHTDGKQAARVEARLPGAIAFRVFSNSRWSIWPQVQKKFGVHAMSGVKATFVPRHNVVLAIGPRGMQFGFGAEDPFLTFAASDVINIALISTNALFGIPIFELRKRDGGTDVFHIQFMYSFFRGMHRDEGMAAVLAMRKAVGLPEIPTDQLWARDPEIVDQGT